MNEMLRFEQSYPLSLAKSRECQRYIEQVLWEDQHSKQSPISGYLVRTLYFDNQDSQTNQADNLPELRLRIYNPKDEWALLELKAKKGFLHHKRSLPLTKEQAEHLSLGMYECLQALHHPFAHELYALMQKDNYRPKVLAEHYRRAFMMDFNNTRVTFDSGTRRCNKAECLFDEHPPYQPAKDSSLVVMDLKYSRFLLGYVHELTKIAQQNRPAIWSY